MKILSWIAMALLLGACAPAQEPGPTPLLEQWRGQWLLVNYWATWCKPCIVEIPELNALGQHYAGVTVVGVNYDGAMGEELARQVEQLGIDFPIVADPALELGVARPAVLPTTLVINPAGELHATLVGPQTLATLAAATEQQMPPGEP
jgi:thiol-disulfide isomerase/thioredoxin